MFINRHILIALLLIPVLLHSCRDLYPYGISDFLSHKSYVKIILSATVFLLILVIIINIIKIFKKTSNKKIRYKKKVLFSTYEAVLKLKDWRKFLYSGEIQFIQQIFNYIYDHEQELQEKERISVALDLYAIWNALPSMKLFGVFYENLTNLTVKFPHIYSQVLLANWSIHTEQEVKSAIHYLKSLSEGDYRFNERSETINSIVSIWTEQDPYKFPEWFKNALIELTMCHSLVQVVYDLIKNAILSDHDFEGVLNSTAALIVINNQEIFRQCLRIAIKKKQYSLYYPTIREAVDLLKKPWDETKKNEIDRAIMLLITIYNEGFYPSLKDVISGVQKRIQQGSWSPSPKDWSSYSKEFIETGEYRRDEIRLMLKLFGPILIPAARSLVMHEKNDRIVQRGALVYLSEAMLMSDKKEVVNPDMTGVKKYLKFIKNLPNRFPSFISLAVKKESYSVQTTDFSQIKLDFQNIQLLRTICSSQTNQEFDQWCYTEAYATLSAINNELYKTGKTDSKESQVDIVAIADVLFREHLRSIMQNLTKAKQGLNEERIIISIHEPVEALRHFSTDLRIPILLKLLKNLDESGLEHVIKIIDECGINQESYPIPENIEATRFIARYWFLRRLLFENRYKNKSNYMWHLRHTNVPNKGAKREIIAYLQTKGGNVLKSLHKIKSSSIVLICLLSMLLFNPHISGQIWYVEAAGNLKPVIENSDNNTDTTGLFKNYSKNNQGIKNRFSARGNIDDKSFLFSKNPFLTNNLKPERFVSVNSDKETISLIISKTKFTTLFIWLSIISGLGFLILVSKKISSFFSNHKVKKNQKKLTVEQALIILETDPWVSKEGVEEIVNKTVLSAIEAISDIQPLEYSEKSKQSIRDRLCGAWKKKDLLNVPEEIGRSLAGCKFFIETLTDVLMSPCPGYNPAMKLGVNKTDLVSRAIDHLQKLSSLKTPPNEPKALEIAINHCIVRCQTKAYHEFDRNQLFYFISKIGWQIVMPTIRTMIDQECWAVKKEGNNQPDILTYTLRTGLVILFTTAVTRLTNQGQNFENVKLLRTVYRIFLDVETSYPHCYLEADRGLIGLKKRVPNAYTLFHILYYAIDNRLQNASKSNFKEGESIIHSAIDFLKSQKILSSITSMIPLMNVKELQKIFLFRQESERKLKDLKKTELFYWQNKAKIMISETLLDSIEQKSFEIIAWLKKIPQFFAYDKLAKWVVQAFVQLQNIEENNEKTDEAKSIIKAILGDEQYQVDKSLKEIINVMYYTKNIQEKKNLRQEIQMVIKFLSFWKDINSLQQSSNTTKLVQRIWAHIPQEIVTPVTNYYTNCTVGKQIAQVLKNQYSEQAKILRLQQCCSLFPKEDLTQGNSGKLEASSQNDRDVLITIIGKEMYQHLVSVFLEGDQNNNNKNTTDISNYIKFLDFAHHYLHLDQTKQEILAGIISHIPSNDLDSILEYYAGLPLLRNLVYEFNTYREPFEDIPKKSVLNIFE